MRPLISLSKRFWACKQTRGPLRSGPGRSTTPTPTPAPQRGSAPGSRLSCTDSPRNFPPKPRRKRSPIYDTTLGFAHGTTLSGTSEPARRERSPAGADAAAGAGGTRRRGQGFAARHRGGGRGEQCWGAALRGPPRPTAGCPRARCRTGPTHQDAHHVGPQLGERLRRAALRRGGGAARPLPLHAPARPPDQRRLPAAAAGPPRPAMPRPPRSAPGPPRAVPAAAAAAPPPKLSAQRQGGRRCHCGAAGAPTRRQSPSSSSSSAPRPRTPRLPVGSPGARGRPGAATRGPGAAPAGRGSRRPPPAREPGP